MNQTTETPDIAQAPLAQIAHLSIYLETTDAHEGVPQLFVSDGTHELRVGGPDEAIELADFLEQIAVGVADRILPDPLPQLRRPVSAVDHLHDLEG